MDNDGIDNNYDDLMMVVGAMMAILSIVVVMMNLVIMVMIELIKERKWSKN